MMNNLDRDRAILLGIVIGMSFLSFFYVFTHHEEPNKQPITPKSNFEVVDHYKGCEVVRWSDDMMSTYKYFLYCPND